MVVHIFLHLTTQVFMYIFHNVQRHPEHPRTPTVEERLAVATFTTQVSRQTLPYTRAGTKRRSPPFPALG